MDSLKLWFDSLPYNPNNIGVETKNKYTSISNDGIYYKYCNIEFAYKICFDNELKRMLINFDKSVIMPNIVGGNIAGLVCRSLINKKFFNYKIYDIPYGAGVNNKPYNNPWFVVESAIDSDIVRKFYPYTIASNGVHLSNPTIEFLKNTSPYSIIGFDNDESGNNAYMNLRKKIKCIRFEIPFNAKDIGEIYENTHLWEISKLYFTTYFKTLF